MPNSKIVRAVGGTIAAIGFCICLYALMRGAMDSQAKIESTGPAIAFCGGFVVMVVGLAALLFASLLARDQGSGAKSLSETTKEFVDASQSPELGAAAVLFMFYGLLGMAWGFAIDEGVHLTWADVPEAVALHLPHVLILIVAVYFARKQGTFFRMSPWQLVAMATAGFALPFVFLLLTN